MRSFRFPALGTQKWVVDKDTQITAVVVSITSVISTDPNLTVLTFETTPAQAQDDSLELYVKSNASVGISAANLAFPLSAGQELYVATSGAGNCQLYLEDIVS